MGFSARIAATRILTLVFGLAVTGAPAAADIESISNNAFVEAFTATNGVFDRPEQIEAFDFADFSESQSAQTEGGLANARQTTRITQSTDSVSVTTSGSSEISHCCTADDAPGPTGAGADAGFSITVCVDERSTFTASGSASVESSGDESTTADLQICCDADGEDLADEEAEDAPGTPRNVTGSGSGVIGPGEGDSCVSLSVNTSASLGSGQPSSATSWTASLSVVSAPVSGEGEPFLWVAGANGSFGNPESWDPVGPAQEGVPTFADGVRRDAAVVAVPGPVTMDLGGAALAARDPRGAGSERRVGRLAVSRTQSLRPTGGTLFLDNLGLDLRGVEPPTIDGRSLEIGRDATLNLDAGIVQARHVAVGSGGDGTLTVQGPDGGFSTLGRFGLGADGDGSFDVTNGATVTTAEAVLGELSGQGSARIAGAGSLWQTGNLAVGLEDDASLTIEGGARVESFQGFVDFGLTGDERGLVLVRGRDAAQIPSTWSVDTFLDVGAGGGIAIREGGALEAGAIRIGVDGSEADCFLGLACIDVADGTLNSFATAIGAGGVGKLRVGPTGRATTEVTFVALDFESRGEIEVVGPSAEEQLSAAGLGVGDELASTGIVRLAAGAKATSTADVRLGSLFGTGLLELADAGGGPDPTRFRVTGAESSLLVGAVSDAPATDLVPPTGEIIFSGGRVELADATLHVQRAGRVSGLGSIVGTGTASVVNDGVIGCGVEIDAPYVQGDEGTLECPQASLPAVPFLDPLSASAFARAVRARPVPPAPPPAGPFVVSGDAALGGTLVLRFLNGFAPAAGAAFPILDASGIVSGGFANVVVQGLVPGSFDFSPATKDGITSFVSLTDAEALPVVTLTGKTKLKEKKKGGLKLIVAREGDAGTALPVSYRVGGTARHGVDFETLSGTIEIPAGKRSAKLVIRPRADGAVESPETIEVSLLPGDGYSVGLFSTVQVELASADKLKPAKSKRR